MSWKKLRHLLFGAAIALAIIAPLGAFAFVKSGLFNVAASHPHTKFTEWITHETMIHSARRHGAHSRCGKLEILLLFKWLVRAVVDTGELISLGRNGEP